MTLEIRVESPDEDVADDEGWTLALNDCVVTAGAPFRMIELGIDFNGHGGPHLSGDGLIVSTPDREHRVQRERRRARSSIRPATPSWSRPLAVHSLAFRPVVAGADETIAVTAVRGERRYDPGDRRPAHPPPPGRRAGSTSSRRPPRPPDPRSADGVLVDRGSKDAVGDRTDLPGSLILTSTAARPPVVPFLASSPSTEPDRAPHDRPQEPSRRPRPVPGGGRGQERHGGLRPRSGAPRRASGGACMSEPRGGAAPSRSASGRRPGPRIGRLKGHAEVRRGRGPKPASRRRSWNSSSAPIAAEGPRSRSLEDGARRTIEPEFESNWCSPGPRSRPTEDVPRGAADARTTSRLRHLAPGVVSTPTAAVQRGPAGIREPMTHLDLDGGPRHWWTSNAASRWPARALRPDRRRHALHQAILRYAFDCMTDEHGFLPMSRPVIVREECMVGTGFFPGGRDQAYHIDESAAARDTTCSSPAPAKSG